jgi:hypothetical protein
MSFQNVYSILALAYLALSACDIFGWQVVTMTGVQDCLEPHFLFCGKTIVKSMRWKMGKN